jgi:hypothetical protein
MKKLILTLTVLAFAFFGAQSLMAADCVEVDIELTPEVVAGATIEGYFELTNCGDDAAVITLALTLQLFTDQTIELPGFPVEMAAGETIARDFSFIAPQPFAGYTFGLCVTATSGDAEASDCASTTIIEGSGVASGGKDDFGINLSMNLSDCVETEFELSDTVTTTPGDFFAEGYFELTNCGDEAATVWLELSIENLDVGPFSAPVELGAGETITRELYFPVPPAVPEGDYTICVTATSGEAMSTSCETIHIISGMPLESQTDGDISVNNYPNPFNPATNIAFTLPSETTVSLKVYNMLGQHVETLVNEEPLSAGKHQISWDGTDFDGNQVASGVYFYRLETENNVISKQMIMVK